MGLIRSPHRRHCHRRICENCQEILFWTTFICPRCDRLVFSGWQKALIIIAACLLFVSLLLVLELT